MHRLRAASARGLRPGTRARPHPPACRYYACTAGAYGTELMAGKTRRLHAAVCFWAVTMTHVMNTYARLPVAFERGEGVWLWDTNGKRYLDGVAGIAVCGLGHSHPKFVAALREQAGKLVHTSN